MQLSAKLSLFIETDLAIKEKQRIFTITSICKEKQHCLFIVSTKCQCGNIPITYMSFSNLMGIKAGTATLPCGSFLTPIQVIRDDWM